MEFAQISVKAAQHIFSGIIQVRFFRPSKTAALRDICILYEDNVLSPENVLGDLLHCGDGGVWQYTAGSSYLHHTLC